MFDIIQKPVVTIIGAGSYGTAIAVALAKNNNIVILWGHNRKHIRTLKMHRSNPVHLPGITFPDLLYLEESLSIALNYCKNILIAVPSYVFSRVLVQLRSNLKSDFRIVIASKGLDPKTGRLLCNVVWDILGSDVPIAVISGPTFARELALGLPAAITVASNDVKFIDDITILLSSIKSLRVYKNTDIVGVQIAGAVKNIIAIGTGISDGIGFGANARIALITRGLAEMSRFGIAVGATADVFYGLAGLGDLVLTCTDNQSRNRRFGILLGQGISVEQAQKNIGRIIEGIYSTQAVYMLSIKYGVVMPITEQIYQVLYKSKNIYESVYSLIRRTSIDETL